MIRHFVELARYRDLLFWLAAKEIKVRYKSPILGFLWTLLVPLLTSLILWLVFTYVVPMPAARYPFFLFLIVGTFPWNFFSLSLSSATMSVLESGALIKKTAFPRAVIPLSIVAANLFNFLLSLVVVIGIILVSGYPLSPWLWLLPVAVGLEVLLTTGVVLLVSGLQVRYRDVKYLTEIGLLFWFYLTPIFYPLDLVLRGPRILQGLYLLNPFVSIIELYRFTLLGAAPGAPISHMLTLGMAAAASLGVFVVGLLVFRRHEPAFADWVIG